jgi:hypothetical protein
MLSASPIAVIPMDSADLFQNAMASQENIPIKITITKNTRTIIIVILMKEIRGKRYSPDYNYYQYYQSMQQQYHPDYNNKNYGYNNDYKDIRISYNNSYADTKKYSTYPTKDKKYVCQRGQFEGFCVESNQLNFVN